MNLVERHDMAEEKERSWIRLYAPGDTPEKETYDQASTTRLVGFSSEASNRSCLKSNLLFSLKYVERPWTPIAKRECEGDPMTKCRIPLYNTWGGQV
jgi:hypothetical protein